MILLRTSYIIVTLEIKFAYKSYVRNEDNNFNTIIAMHWKTCKIIDMTIVCQQIYQQLAVAQLLICIQFDMLYFNQTTNSNYQMLSNSFVYSQPEMPWTVSQPQGSGIKVVCRHILKTTHLLRLNSWWHLK